MRRIFFASMVALLTACSGTPENHARTEPEATAVAETSATLTVAPEPRCGSVAGLQDAAAWPMRGGCPTHAAVAQVHGSTQGAQNWTRPWLLVAPGASPVIGADGAVYVGTTTGVAVVDSATGADRWGTFLALGARATPAIARDGTVYIGADTNRLHAIDPITHAERWSIDTGAYITASPVIGADGTIYVGNLAGSLHAIRPNGTVKWKFATGSAIESSAAIGPDGLVYFGANNGTVYALDANGLQKWKRTGLTAVRSSPAVHKNTVYVGSDANRLHALEAATGAIKWEKDLAADVRSSPAVGPTGNVYVGSLSGKVHAFSPTGTALWSYTTGGPVYSSPTIDVDGRVYIGSDDKKLYALSGNTGQLIFAYAAGAAVRSTPALDASGRVTFADENLDLYSVGLGSAADRYTVDATVAPADPVNLDSVTGESEPTSGFVIADGDDFEFTANEILLAGNATQLNQYLSLYGGTLQQTVDAKPEPGDELTNIYTIRVDPARTPDPATIAANLRLIDPTAEPETFRVSDAQGLSLLALWADARARGLEVEVDFVGGPTSIATGVTTEGATVPFRYNGGGRTPGEFRWTKTAQWSTNPFDWIHFARDATQSIGVAQAWQRLNNAGKLTRSVRVALMDTGFSGDAVVAREYPNAPLVPLLPGPYNNVFGPAGLKNEDAWHGTAAAHVGFGRPDNGEGAAGTGEPVVSKIVLSRYRKKANLAHFLYHIITLKDEGVDILNASLSIRVYTAMAGGMARKAVDAVNRKKILVVTGPGNSGKNVDKTSGLLNNEKTAYLPCELNGVLCVGGLKHDSVERDLRSNWGNKDVNLWAPYVLVAGPLPDGRGTEEVWGTSFSGPFVAGIAALVKAANKNLSAGEIRTILIETAKKSTDTRVSRIVQADAAVERALPAAPPIPIL